LSGETDALRPIAPYAQTAQLYATRGAHAPAATRAAEILWHDDRGLLHRLAACDDQPEVHCAPYAMAHAPRLVSTSSALWVIDESRASLQRYDQDTLTRLSAVEIADSRVIDIASDGYDALFALLEHDGSSHRSSQPFRSQRWDGDVRGRFPCYDVCLPRAVQAVRRMGR
jgi:hypothetical protein